MNVSPSIAQHRLHWRARAAILAAALWWGSVTTIGFLVVPLLFANLPTTAIAGSMAARLFTAQVWLALGCGLVLLLSSRGRDDPAVMDWAGGALAFVVGGLLLALLSEFAVAPHIVARDNLALWHSLGSAMYVLQWLCAGVVLWKVTGSKSPSPRT